MTQQRAEFISGIVLGVGLGLLLSHFLISQAPRASVPPAGNSSLAVNDLLLDSRFPFGSSLLDDRWHVNALPDEEEEQDPPLPLRNALALETASESLQQMTNELVPIEPAASGAEPEPLQIGEAAPLSRNSTKDQQTIQGIIDIELDHLPPEKRQVWYEALKDVNKEDVAGILRMWKLLGGPIPESPVDSTSATPFFPDHPESIPELSETSQANRQRSQIENMINTHANNIKFRNTPGYIPRIPYLPDPAVDSDQIGVLLDWSRTRHLPTGMPLHVAIRGAGFFLVQQDDGTEYYTRCGQFTIDSQQQLALSLGNRIYVLQPVIQFPEPQDSPGQIQIDADGRITLGEPATSSAKVVGQLQLMTPSDSSVLNMAEGILFRRSASDRPLRVTTGSGQIVQGSLELSAIEIDEELAGISLLQSLDSP